MMTGRYKALLPLTADERRGLNTFAAIHGLTPTRYVAAALRARLEIDAGTFGLSIGPVGDQAPLDGQLTLDDQEAPTAASTGRKRAPRAKQDSAPKRRTSR
jgi:hypothetical protein